jgi:hypothetical protein
MENYSELLIKEITHNLERLSADLAYLKDPSLDGDSFGEGYVFSAFKEFCTSVTSPATDSRDEMLHAFYRSLEVMQTGHPNLISAEPRDLEQAFGKIIESAIEFGKSILDR